MREEAERVVRRLTELLTKSGITVDAVYVFGSSARGDWIKGSDVDVILVSRDFEGVPFLKRMDMVEELQWRERLSPHVEALPLTPKELEEKLKSSAVIMDAPKYWKRLA